MTLAKQHRQSGFTLIELTIAAVVLSLVVVSIASLFIAIEDTNRQARNFTLAVQLEHQLMESSRNSSYEALTIGSTDFSSSLPTSLLPPRSATSAVTEVDPGGLKKLDISISWTEHTHIRSVQTSTYIASRGLDR